MESLFISDWFWDIIERAGDSRDKLRSILSEMGKDEIYRFQDEFLEAAAQLRDEPFSDLIYASGESEDGLDDISKWVVSQGRHYYDAVLANPESIPLRIDGRSHEILYGVADEVYLERFGELTGIY